MREIHYLKRKIDRYLDEWYAGKRLPLIVKGPRQVGKTASIRHFAAGKYENIVEVNFVSDPKYRTIIADGYGAQEVVNALSRLNNSFRFVENAFGEGQEMLLLVTDLSVNKYTMAYINDHGCDRYFDHNKQLLFHERGSDLIDRINRLDLNEEE